jgi:hypothetical protein
VDFLIGLCTALLGLVLAAAPWIIPLTGNALAVATMIIGGVIVTLQGLALIRRAPRMWRTGRGQR